MSLAQDVEIFNDAAQYAYALDARIKRAHSN